MSIKFKNFLSEKLGFIYGNGDYNFIEKENMPKDNYISNTITRVKSVDWITTGYTYDLADNHCGATAVVNLALYFDKLGYNKLKINNSKMDTFKSVYKIVGDGPVLTIYRGARKYFRERGYKLCKSKIDSFNEIKNAIDNNYIVGILLSNGILDWHWVLAIGYREYENGDIYMRIINGWDNTADIFYKINSGAFWFSATKYYIL